MVAIITPLKVGTEFLVNTYTYSYQGEPAIAALADGGYLVTWSSETQDGDGYGVYAQRFDKDSVKVGKEFQVNTYTYSYQSSPAIAALTDGGFLVTWLSNQNGDGYYDVYAQRYDKDSVKVGEEFLVNTYTKGSQDEQEIVALTDGGYLVTYTSYNQNGNDSDVYAQRFDKDNNKVGEEFLVNTYIYSYQSSPAIAALTDGGYLVTWSSEGQDGDTFGVYAQRFDKDNNKVGEEFLVNTYTYSDQTSPAIAALTDGGFLVTWLSNQNGDGYYDVYAQRYDKDSVKVGEEFLGIKMVVILVFMPKGMTRIIIRWVRNFWLIPILTQTKLFRRSQL
jgi:hypothetical protein